MADGNHYNQLFQLAPAPESPPYRRRQVQRASLICNVAMLAFLIGCAFIFGLSQFVGDFFFDIFLFTFCFALLFLFVLVGTLLSPV